LLRIFAEGKNKEIAKQYIRAFKEMLTI
jgi:hypothetical protein